MRARLIVSAILFAAFCGSIVMLVMDLRDRDPIKLGPTRETSAWTETIAPTNFPGYLPNTLPPQIPQVIPTSPAGVFSLTDWKLTLPSGGDEPDEVDQPKLATFQDPRYFHVDPVGGGVVFRAPVGGATTANSSYPRSELREMADGGKKEASWSGKKGTHVMTITEAVTALPKKKPEVVAGQIHDDEDDVVMLRLNGTKLFVESDSDSVGVLDPAYQLGTRFTVQFVVTPGLIRVTYNGTKTLGLKRKGSGYYFKAGCYTQSNEDDHDGNVYGEVVVYSLSVQHTA
ncbi:MAG TPA: polysaccharide lyase family 7 protein [Aeromicrobium sp.]|nr:polysaccharide lyase family 7 protein [Aeromicrobium sp.]